MMVQLLPFRSSVKKRSTLPELGLQSHHESLDDSSSAAQNSLGILHQMILLDPGLFACLATAI